MRIVEQLCPVSWNVPSTPQPITLYELGLPVEEGTLIGVEHLGYERDARDRLCRLLRLTIADLRPALRLQQVQQGAG